MIDTSKTLKPNGDIYILDFQGFKTRNVFSMNKGDDPYYTETGLNKAIIREYRLNESVIRNALASYLRDNSIQSLSMDLTSDVKGQLDINITEEYSILKINDGVVTKGNTKGVKTNVNI